MFKGCNEPWSSLSYTTMLFLFGDLNNQNFLGFINNNNDNNNESKNLNSFLILKPPPDLAFFLINSTMLSLRITVIQKM